MIYLVQHACDLVAEHVEGGLCSNHPTVLARVNEAVRRLIKKDDYSFTLDQVRIWTKNNSVSLPKEYVSARLVTVNSCPVPIKSQMFEYIASGPGKCTYDQLASLVDEGLAHPTFFDIPKDGTNYVMIAHSTATGDANKVISWKGRSSNGSDILTGGLPVNTLTIGTWAGGVEGELSAYPAHPSAVVHEVLGIALPTGRTGYVTLHAYDPSTHAMYFLSKYAPSEQYPSYRRYRLPWSDNQNGVSVDLLCKKRFLPATLLTDTLLIQDLDAIKNEVVAIGKFNSGDINGGVAYSQLAERELQKSQSNETRGITFHVNWVGDSTRTVNII